MFWLLVIKVKKTIQILFGKLDESFHGLLGTTFHSLIDLGNY
jgi:hypothetical protein